MKILDRHVLHQFSVPFAYCVCALALLFVVYDLFDNLPDFVQHGIPARPIVLYYVMLLPNTLVLITPWAVLLAILYEMAQFARNNEITAMRSSGQSVVRVAGPLLAVGFVLTLAVLALNELAAPPCLVATNRFLRNLENPGQAAVDKVRVLPFRNEQEQRTWLIHDFEPDGGKTGAIEVSQEDEAGRKLWTIRAESAMYFDGRWWFFDGRHQDYDPEGLPRLAGRAPDVFAKREMTGLTENPRHFLNENRAIAETADLSSGELLTYLRIHGWRTDDNSLKVGTMLHYRLATPLTCLMVILIGVPCGVRADRRGAALGVASAIGVVTLYYFAVQAAFVFGKGGYLAPWAAGWAPNLVFGVGGAILLFRAR